MGKENKSRYALLGMLSLKAMSGYDLKKAIEYSVGNFWNESYPQIYPVLKQLAKDGLAIEVVERQEGRPDRHVYQLTEKGWEELRHWLTEPFEYQVQRNELLLKLFFGGLTQVTINVEHVQRHRDMQVQLLEHYKSTMAHLLQTQEPHPQLPYWLMTLSYGMHIAQALIDWCDETLVTLEQLASKETMSKQTMKEE